MKISPFSIMLLIALCSSCQKDELSNGNENVAYDPSKIVCFTGEAITRGTPVASEAQMVDMGVFCSHTGYSDWSGTAVLGKMFNEQLLRNSTSGAWQYVGTPVQWGSNSSEDRYTFFAYAPYASGVYNPTSNTKGNGIVVNGTNTSTGIPTLTYTVPENCANQPDLMVAIPQHNIRPTGKSIALSFRHTLTCVGFEIQGAGTENLTGVKVRGIITTGTLTLGGGANDLAVWNIGTSTSTADFPVSLNTSSPNWDANNQYYKVNTSMSTDLLAGNGYLMMIPQVLGVDAKLVLSFSGSPNKEVPLDTHNWEMGKKVIYQITLTAIP